ncbi:MAG: single-stranded DNA-binding protein [Dialister sp.]|uniref:single-stranded DNA-binding protein n=1 Tax=Dialister sp. TaxID=1955814 RepID=UPI001DE37C21|nr:single-stranded DNA-binding protein [Dialister sp.]MBS6715391.1 single-stranded DNA-binding protein [Dialister sp.]
MLNHITIMGRLAKDPELRRTQAGVPVASFRLAVERDFKDTQTGQRSVDWVDVVAWRATAEFVRNKRVSAEVIASSVYFGDRGEESGQNGLHNSSVSDSVSGSETGSGIIPMDDSGDGELPF